MTALAIGCTATAAILTMTWTARYLQRSAEPDALLRGSRQQDRHSRHPPGPPVQFIDLVSEESKYAGVWMAAIGNPLSELEGWCAVYSGGTGQEGMPEAAQNWRGEAELATGLYVPS